MERNSITSSSSSGKNNNIISSSSNNNTIAGDKIKGEKYTVVEERDNRERIERERAPCGMSSGSGLFSCNSTCYAVLSCGRHLCNDKCHGDNCKTCIFSPSLVYTCPCGAKLITDLLGGKNRDNCMEEIPTCKGIC